MGSRMRRGTMARFFSTFAPRPLPSRSLYTIPLASLQAAKTLPCTLSEFRTLRLTRSASPFRLALRLDRSVQLRQCSTPSRLLSRSKCRKCSRLGAPHSPGLTRPSLYGAPGTAARRTASRTVAPTATRRATTTTTRASKSTLVRACFISAPSTMPDAVADSLSIRPRGSASFFLISPTTALVPFCRTHHRWQLARKRATQQGCRLCAGTRRSHRHHQGASSAVRSFSRPSRVGALGADRFCFRIPFFLVPPRRF